MANTYTNLLCHIVFSTKNRKPLIREDDKEALYAYIGGIVRGERGAQLEIGGMPDHLHILASFKADTAVATMLRRIKANSSGWMNRRPGARSRFGWQTGYAAFSVSESQVEKVRQYIRNQPEHHRRKTFQEQSVELLRKHKVDFNEKYLWD